MKRLLLLASVLIVGCSSSNYQSREEASIAADEWVNSGKVMTVVQQPTTPEEISDAKSHRLETPQERCEYATGINSQIKTPGFLHTLNNSQRKKAVSDAKLNYMIYCSVKHEREWYLVATHDGDQLNITTVNNTRWCEEKKDSKRFVCMNNTIPVPSGTDVDSNDWINASISYRYFRY